MTLHLKLKPNHSYRGTLQEQKRNMIDNLCLYLKKIFNTQSPCGNIYISPFLSLAGYIPLGSNHCKFSCLKCLVVSIRVSNDCGGILAHSSLQNCFSSVTFVDLQAWTACFRLCHNTSIRFRSALWMDTSPSQILNFFFFFNHCEVDLLVCFGSLSCHGLVSWPNCASAYRQMNQHHTITTMLHIWYGVLILKRNVRFSPDITGQPKSSTLDSSIHNTLFQSSGGSSRCV